MFRRNHVYLTSLFFCITVLVIDAWKITSEKNSLGRQAVDDFYNKAQDESFENSWEFSNRMKQPADDVDEEELQKKLQELPANDELFEGDIMMDDRLRNAVLGVSKKSVIALGGIKWPNNTLFYEVDPNFIPKGKILLKKAIDEFEKRTCIRFKKRTNEPNYVYFTSEENVCSSNIGMTTGKQKIRIGRDCMVLGTFLHEIMHALGFIHEHSRPDRDEYVKVKWNNIKKDEWSNFNKYTFADVNDEGIKYNFASVMHYRNDAFTKNGENTLTAKGEDDLKFGQRVKFSVGDVMGINHFYNCLEEIKKPNYQGLFKDYSGQKDQMKEKRVEQLRRLFRDRIFDHHLRNTDYDKGR